MLRTHLSQGLIVWYVSLYTILSSCGEWWQLRPRKCWSNWYRNENLIGKFTFPVLDTKCGSFPCNFFPQKWLDVLGIVSNQRTSSMSDSLNQILKFDTESYKWKTIFTWNSTPLDSCRLCFTFALLELRWHNKKCKSLRKYESWKNILGT